jgi:hypothetical protein
MGRVESIFTKKRGRFVVITLENLPQLPWTRFLMPSTELELDNRVQIRVDIHIYPPKSLREAIR